MSMAMWFHYCPDLDITQLCVSITAIGRVGGRTLAYQEEVCGYMSEVRGNWEKPSTAGVPWSSHKNFLTMATQAYPRVIQGGTRSLRTPLVL